MIQDIARRDGTYRQLREDSTPLTEEPTVVDGLFGWFSPGICRRGVVMCGTLGFEQLSAHRSWRALAEQIAATGCSVLRFDYPGEGDSAGDAAVIRTAACVTAIRRAVRMLREVAGAEEIVLVGLRFGATLALLAAAEEAVDRLILLAPFSSGRAFLREMKMRAVTIATLPDGTPLPQEEGLFTLGGFHLEAESVADLNSVDLTKLDRTPAPHILLIGDAASLATRLSASGAAVESRPFPGLANLIANPLFAEEPKEVFAAVAAFAGEGALPCPSLHKRALPFARLSTGAWTEEGLRFGAGMFGIICKPLTARPGPVVLFVNAGRNIRSGWGRQTTARARRLAAEGTASLRIDLGGIGDSVDRIGGDSPLYNLSALDDVRASLDVLEGCGLGPVVIVGACSGAYLGFHALCSDPRLKGALLINLYCFDWSPEQDVETVLRNGLRSVSTYASLLRKGSAWRRLLHGEIRVRAIVLALARMGRSVLRQRIRRVLRPPVGGTIKQRIAILRRRGAHLRLVYSSGDPGLADLRLQLGRSPASTLGRSAAIIQDADHDLSTRDAQAQLDTHLAELLTLSGRGPAARSREPDLIRPN